jgi:mRNA interferase RelE/StbE
LTAYRIVWTLPADGQLRALDPMIRRRIASKVDALARDPFRYLTRLVNSPYYRLRVGDFRVIVAVEAQIVTIVVLQVVHRRNAHR